MSFRNWLLLMAVSTWFMAMGKLADAQTVSDTAFTYQGLLKQNGTGVTQQCDFQFSLWTGNNAPDVGVQVGADVQLTTTVEEGIFTAHLDFGADALDGSARWLNIEVCCPSGCAPGYTELVPRQALTSAPYSIQTRGIFVDDGMNVGIGTNSPNAMLTVGSGDGAVLHVGQQPQLKLSKDTAGDKFRMELTGSGYGGNALQIGRDDTTHDLILSGDVDIVGVVGIGLGTELPNSLLHVGVGSEANFGMGKNPQLTLDKDTRDGKFRMQLTGSGYGNYLLQIGRDDMTHDIYLSGKVGIGTENPTNESNLHSRVTSDNFGVLADAGGSNGSQIGLHTGPAGYASVAKNAYFVGGWQRFDSGAGAYLQEVEPDGDTTFSAAPAGANPIAWNRAMVIKPNGRIGMGTNNPFVKLHIVGSQTVDGNQTVTGNVNVQGISDIGLELVRYIQVGESIAATCPTSKIVISGGCFCLDSYIVSSSPRTLNPDGVEGWGCLCDGDGAGVGNFAYALCARVVRSGFGSN